jgi:hypothetical protein
LVTNYYRQFVSTTEVIEEQWGKFYPEKLAVSASDADKDIARDKYLSMIFLAGVDKAQFGTLIDDLNNSHLAGNDQYPVLFSNRFIQVVLVGLLGLPSRNCNCHGQHGHGEAIVPNSRKCS